MALDVLTAKLKAKRCSNHLQPLWPNGLLHRQEGTIEHVIFLVSVGFLPLLPPLLATILKICINLLWPSARLCVEILLREEGRRSIIVIIIIIVIIVFFLFLILWFFFFVFLYFFISSPPTRYQQPIRNHFPICLCLFENHHPTAYRPTETAAPWTASADRVSFCHILSIWTGGSMMSSWHAPIRVQDHWKPSWSQAALRGGHSARSSWLGCQLSASCQWTSTSLAIFSPLQVALIHILHALFSFALEAL